MASARWTRSVDTCAIGAEAITPLLRAVSLNLSKGKGLVAMQAMEVIVAKGAKEEKVAEATIVAKEAKEAKAAEATGSENKISQRQCLAR